VVDDSNATRSWLTNVYEAGLLVHCICAIVRLGVPDLLAKKSMGLSDLAASADACEEPLWRVLRFLAAHGLVTLHGDSQIELSEKGRLLCKEYPGSMWAAFAAVGAVDTAHALVYTLRTGNAAAEQALGASFWSYLAAHPREQELFDANMRRQARALVWPYIAELDWPAGGTIADIGGGVGTLLAAVLEKIPNAQGVLVEQPQVIAQARTFLTDMRLIDRCDLRHGDLFTAPPRADIYLLSFVLHDWPDGDARRILSAIRQGAAPSSRLRIFERLIANGDFSRRTPMFDIGMLLLTNGRERTAGEMEGLLEDVGWEIEGISSSHDPIKMIQARPRGLDDDKAG